MKIANSSLLVRASASSALLALASSPSLFAAPQIGVAYCSSTPNSSGVAAQITAMGSTDLALNSVVLQVSGAAPLQFGLFYFGTLEVMLPFGNGTRCVAGNVQRLNPPMQTDALGVATRAINFMTQPASTILPGDTQKFQFWFRDGGNFDLSDGLSVTFDAPADLILQNGFIYTVDATSTVASAVAVRDGEIIYVGSDAGAAAFLGAQTEVVDLAGKMVMPGIHDSHVHILEANFEPSGTCILPVGQSIPSYIPIIQACAPNQIGTNWVVGFGHSIFDMHPFMESGGSPKGILDIALPNRPGIFMEETSHSVWVNSLALQAAGITAATPDPPGGVILRDPVTGEPNGVLLDAAGELVMDLALSLPNPVFEQANYDALLAGLAESNQNGITSLCDARGYWKRGHIEAWERARDQGTLSVRAIVGLWAYPYELNDAQQIADLTALYSNDPDSLLRCSQVKIYADGEISHTTAALLQPYDLDPFFFNAPLAGPVGINVFDEARMTSYVTQLEAVGFDAHIHAIGDRGVRQALNAIEAADAANGGAFDTRHRLTHVHLVQAADVPRFAQLGVIADFQPFGGGLFDFFYSIYLMPGLIQQEGEQLRTLYDSGARVVLSSDYDVGSLSPFIGIRTALTMGQQSLPSRDAAIRAYTIEPAYLMRQEDRVGSIEPGKRADLIVLDRNITTIPVTQISSTVVLWTLLDGEEVWRDPSF